MGYEKSHSWTNNYFARNFDEEEETRKDEKGVAIESSVVWY